LAKNPRYASRPEFIGGSRFNHRRLYEYDGDIPPAELEDAYYAHQRAQPVAELSNQ